MREAALSKAEILAVVDTPKKIIVAFMWSLIGAVYTLGAFSGIMTVHPAIIVNNTDNTEMAVEVMSAIGSLWTDPSH
ncbi:MAG: hypothetical protein AB2669_07935 [Candidatus Thiodiazotropha endolucinida]|nr:hypothetical protein [Candidatus Thiodiazotropha taylori]MCW4249652.1 hypothetical protein [Candidatus Thiodiazotropha endolucinida]MCG7883040.1 hypothetical protein [Candidatus Thiodiazotropha taylori]MCG8058682.1 hypothetical protein [Candidatus Thiodiazotropha taylori]MCG8104620.1 hypothetical protein [Candidatus Thiodiazotropha taylori]